MKWFNDTIQSMLQSQLFTKTRKEAPKDELAKNAQLLIRGGFINKEMAGVYDFLPLGLRVLNKIISIIREEMNKIGGQELFMSSLQRPEIWRTHFEQDRWDDKNIDNWFKTKLKEGGDLGLAFTHEEPVSNMLEQFVSSYKDLPFSVYQFQTKFRNETRAKSGIMRTREFIMKDLYSFSRDQVSHEEIYNKVKKAYRNIFDRVGIGEKTYLTFASGGTFSKFSHEFQAVTDAGEDTIYITRQKVDGEVVAINKEVFTDDVKRDLGLRDTEFEEKKSVEVGNIFTLGTKFSKPNLSFTNKAGEKEFVIMGSYGIGPGRLMGTIAEVLSDDAGLVWPMSVAPFRAHIILVGDSPEVRAVADDIYEAMKKDGVEALMDDRDARAGEKFADADLIGIPYRLVVSEKTLAQNSVEVKVRATGKTDMISIQDVKAGKF